MKAGIYQIDGEAYHADPAPAPSLSSTAAKVMLSQSPLHAWTQSRRLNPDWQPNDRKTFDIGRAAHRVILGAGGGYIAIPDEILASNGAASTKEAKAFIADARASGLTPLKADEVAQIAAMQAVAEERLRAMGITFDPAMSEQVALAEIDGVWCRAMVDNAPLDERQPLWDFKTCENASPDACERAILNYGYDVQAAHYLETWKAATGQNRLFRFVFQEKSAPHEICIIELGPESLMMASKRIARARQMWGMCLRYGCWPGYPAGVHRVELPEWYHAKWLERESEEFDHKQRTGQDVLESAMRFMAPENH